MENNIVQERAWCFDVRTGWTEIEDVVWARCPENTMDEKALSRAGFHTGFLRLGEDPFTLAFEIFRSDAATGPRFYVRFALKFHTEHFYLANVPSLMAWLKDAAPILQAGLLNELVTLECGASVWDNFRSYIGELAQGGCSGRR